MVPSPIASDVMPFSRRDFIGLVVTGAAGAIGSSCTSDHDSSSDVPRVAAGPSELDPPAAVFATPPLVTSQGESVGLSWAAVRDAQSYDVELNGQMVARSNQAPSFEIGQGDGRTGLSSGVNRVRVRGRAGELEGSWSTEQTFVVQPSKVVKSRGFDAEDDGDIALTTGGDDANGGTVLRVATEYAFGGQGKGIGLICTDPAYTKAYKNYEILQVEECWVRISFSPRAAGSSEKRIQLARINDPRSDASERLYWVTGRGVCSSSVKVVLSVPEQSWVQLQLGVDSNGKVELWAFDGHRETLVGTGRSELIGADKGRVSIGNHNPNIGFTFEAWMDDFAVGEARLPWVRHDDSRQPNRPKPLVASELPRVFSFVFGSCTNSNHVPATGTALAGAADCNPDFVLHLGDFGYLDSAAYAQTRNGYLASWSDLMAGDHMSRLAQKPWIFMSSDHDLGGNNVTASTVAPFAADALAQFQSNDSAVDGVGRYGSVEFDDGRVLLAWTEGVLYRSRLDDPQAEGNTKLGPEQKAWLLNLLATTTAKLVIIGSETTVGHRSVTSWSNHPAEREELIQAARACPAQVRILSGDLHRARWAQLADNLVEWGAAALSEFPEGVPEAISDVLDSSVAEDFNGYRSRPTALAALTLAEFNATTTYGFASIDTISHAARFELRRSDGTIRVDERGEPMSESVIYG